MGKCKYSIAWVGLCGKPVAGGTEYCTEHLLTDSSNERELGDKSKCCVCKEQATHECSETFQFVCGFPLCDKEECKRKHHPNYFHD